MGFDRRDIRPTMDVYTRDNVYLGTVQEVYLRDTGLRDEEGTVAARQSSAISGEVLGPMPTLPLGNPGPETQSASAAYATDSEPARTPGVGAFTVGRWWGLIGRRTIPITAVQTVSLERIVLAFRRDELPVGDQER